MRLKILVLPALLLVAATSFAQDTGVWQTDLEAAKRMAFQSRRLVLVHFWAPWCAPCKKLDTEVFAQPGFEQALAAQCVPVKLNVDEHPELVRQWGVTAVPTDVMLLPDGRIVDRVTSPATGSEYLAHINQVYAGLRAPQLAAPPAGYGNQGPAPMAATAAAPPMQNQSMSPPVPQPSGVTSQPMSPAAYAQPAAPTNGPPGYAYQQPAAAPGPGVAPGVPVMSQQTDPQALPMGLDGNCPVELCEHHKWIAGNREFGRTYRGRTYLFSSHEAMDKFIQNPDRFSPVASGFDPVVSIEQGQTALGQRQHGVFYGDRIYLFANEQSLEKFKQNPNRYSAEVLQARR